MSPGLLTLPAEVRSLIYEECFPSMRRMVQLIPYSPAEPACRLGLPLALYRVCRLIHAELPPLSSKLRSLDHLYLIEASICRVQGDRTWECRWDRRDHSYDPRLLELRCRTILPLARSIRLVEVGEFRYRNHQTPSRLAPPQLGSEYGLRVLELETTHWPSDEIASTIDDFFKWLSIHLHTTHRIEVCILYPAIWFTNPLDRYGPRFNALVGPSGASKIARPPSVLPRSTLPWLA